MYLFDLFSGFGKPKYAESPLSITWVRRPPIVKSIFLYENDNIKRIDQLNSLSILTQAFTEN